ncbi:hypothetical protein GCM10027037_06210 [Mucilaginibacter koreensis]
MSFKYLLSTLFLLCSICAYAQEATTQVEDKITPEVSIKYHVLSANKKVMQGLYQAFYKKNTPVASGLYEHNEKAGTWHFFDKTGKLMQHYNYTKHLLTYEAPDDSTSGIKYVVDEDFKQSDTITKPIRIGGRYFGYLPYLNLFRLPKDLYDFAYVSGYGEPTVYLEFLISPAGRLADYRVHIKSYVYGEKVLAVKIDQLSDDDKSFYPATLNGREISCRILLSCKLKGSNLEL